MQQLAAVRGEAPPTAALVEIADVCKEYATEDGPVMALDQVSLDVGEYEFLAVLGPSGCGKSTLLLIVAGLVPATTGRVRIARSEVRRPWREVGIAFQDATLYDWRRVLDNVLLPAQIQGMDGAAARQRALELLDLVGLGGFERKYPFELSGGMRQRVALCRALIHAPTLLLLDEPFGALDALTRDQLNLELLSICQRPPRKTVLFITHSITEAVFLSDRVVVMSPRPGRVASVVPIELPRPRTLAVTETPEFAAYTHTIRAVFQSWGMLKDRLAEPSSAREAVAW
ncbi:MAG TPA: ABC transporter ATP-binding protein [Chloroflexota bacterium]|nr:ABC transporter ATP-binding protein [Chloroflexota bacterium]